MKNSSVLESAVNLIARLGNRTRQKGIGLFVATILTATVIVVAILPGTGWADPPSSPIFVKEIPVGFRDWKLISVAHEEGELNDIRAILGNDLAVNAYRDGKLPFPEGAIIARIAWRYVPSDENNKIFGKVQSFVPGEAPPWYLQFMVKDSKKYAATGGWGYSQFDKDHKPGPDSDMNACFPCHQAIKERDFIFTRYAP